MTALRGNRNNAVVRAEDNLERYVAAAIEGDNVAVAHLVRATQPVVWRLCTALGSRGAEEDLVQETYLRAFRSLHSYRGDSPFQNWLLSIARRVCADDVRRRVRSRRLENRLSSYARDRATHPAEPIEHLIGDLECDRREAFVLTQVLGLSYEEAADVLGCPIGTVRSRVSRARADLAATVRHAQAQ